MSVTVIRMPDIGEGIAEVEIVEWRVAVGDEVAEDQTLCDVMTDKAAVEVPSPVAGRVIELGGEVGQVMAVGSLLIRIDSGDSSDSSSSSGGDAEVTAHAAPAPAPAAAAAAAASKPPATPAASPPPSPDVPTPPKPAAAATPVSPPMGGRPAPPTAPRALAAPAVRERARALGIDLARLQGSGPDGRIVHADLDAAAAPARPGTRATASPPASPPNDGTREVKLIGLRRAIAQKMLQSKRSIPHFTYVEEVDVTEMVALREELNRQYAVSRGELSPLALVIRAIVRAVADFPQVNARFDDEAGVLNLHDAVHLGVATQTDGGLMVPVVRQAQTLNLWDCSEAIAQLAAKARAGKATRDQLSGSTLTVTSLGKLGGIVTTPVINHPEVAIVGVNRIVARPMVRGLRDGTVQIRQMMNLSSSFDHRVVDGAVAAGYIQRVRQLLETPATLFIE
jgi:2-oxoisovalerate dehydrogenase E2 component (dihydrolipoyl transacylase)